MKKISELVDSLFGPLDQAYFKIARNKNEEDEPYTSKANYYEFIHGHETLESLIAEKMEAVLGDYFFEKIDRKTYLKRIGEYTTGPGEMGDNYLSTSNGKDFLSIKTGPLLVNVFTRWMKENTAPSPVQAAEKLLSLIQGILPHALRKTLHVIALAKLPEKLASYQIAMVDALLEKAGKERKNTVDALLTYAAHGNLRLMKHLVEKWNAEYGNIYSGHAMQTAASNGAEGIIDYLFDLKPIEKDRRESYFRMGAAASPYAPSLYLLKKVFPESKKLAIRTFQNDKMGEILVAGDRVDVLEFLIDNGCAFAGHIRMLSKAAAEGKFKALHSLLGKYKQLHTNTIAYNQSETIFQYPLKEFKDLLADLYESSKDNFFVMEILEKYSSAATQKIKQRDEYPAYLRNKKHYIDSGNFSPEQVMHILHLDMSGINPSLYLHVQRLLEIEGYPAHDSMNQTMARRACQFFKQEMALADCLKNHGKVGRTPLHDILEKLAYPAALVIRHPDEASEKIRRALFQNWRSACIQIGDEMMKLMVFCLEQGMQNPVFPEKNDRGHWSVKLTKEKIIQRFFSDNKGMADMALKLGAPLSVVVEAQKIVGKWKTQPTRDHDPSKYLPDLEIDGKNFGRSSLRLRKLPLDDPRALFIGAFTECCQRLDKEGHESLRHMYETGASGLYVLENKKTGEIKGHTWAWRGTEGELCFDNAEWKSRAFSARSWRDLFPLITAQVRKDKKATGITRILAGKSQKMPDLGAQRETNTPAIPLDYSHNAYRESKKQYQLD